MFSEQVNNIVNNIVEMGVLNNIVEMGVLSLIGSGIIILPCLIPCLTAFQPCLMAFHQGVTLDSSIAPYPRVILEFFSVKTFLPISEFAPISLYLVISLLLSLILIGASFAFASKGPAYPDKLSAYECGFDPFGDARSRFDIRFYLVSLLFIIFDLEVTFLFPWAVSLNKIGWFGFWSMMVFVWILTIGFLYEWKKGALDWE